MKNKNINWIKALGMAIFLIIGAAALLYSIFGWPFSKKEAVDIGAFDNNHSVHFIDCDHGDSFLILSEDQAALLDTGTKDGGKKVIAYLKKLGIKKLDYLILTHPHGDHIGGAAGILDNFEVDALYLGKISEEVRPESSVYLNFLKRMKEYEGKVKSLSAGDFLEIGSFSAKILGPLASYEELNDQSMVMRLEYGEISFLLTADQQDAAERDLMEKYDPALIDADVLKVGHHGSEGSTSAEFLKAVSPEYAVISCGENTHGHPYQSVLDRLHDFDLNLLRTDDRGTIVMETDGKTLKVKTER